MTPDPSTPASLHLYTAEISRIYLDATENLDIKLAENLTISCEVVQIPSTYVAADRLTEGTLVERLGGMLERFQRVHESILTGSSHAQTQTGQFPGHRRAGRYLDLEIAHEEMGT